MPTLYLIETKAANPYLCSACNRPILRGTPHFRHDPYPYARQYRGQQTTHWCRECILNSDPGPKDRITSRLRVPAVRVLSRSQAQHESDQGRIELVRIAVVGIAPMLAARLAAEPELVHRFSPGEFEEFVCDRLAAMGLEPKRVGPTNKKDGGIDIVFWPRSKAAFPFLGAAQVKHHRNPSTKEGPSTVREFAGAISGHPFNAGIIVTNTSFSPDAQWYARERANLIRLREFQDIRRWMFNKFDDDAEWREMPSSIELCPGVVVKLWE
jgi:Restriction endonuclease